MLTDDSPVTIIVGFRHLRPGDTIYSWCSVCHAVTAHTHIPGTKHPLECQVCQQVQNDKQTV